MEADDDDDRSSDSDYVPCDDGADGEEDDRYAGADSCADLPDISTRRKRKANDLWKELRDSDSLEVNAKMHKAIGSTGRNAMLTDGVEGKDVPTNNGNKPSKKKQKVEEKKRNSQLKEMISAVFGYSIKKSKAVTKLQKPKKRSNNNSSSSSSGIGLDVPVAMTSSTADAPDSLATAAAIAARSLAKSITVTETRKFAGQNIIVSRKEIALGGDSDAKPKAKPISKLDEVLDTMKGPKTISTVSKSSMDWDSFKEEEKLADELTAAKNGYLSRQEFLERCDYRKFETERDERLAQAASRAKQ